MSFSRSVALCVHTPLITASDCEARVKMFRVTTLDAKIRR